MIEIHNKNKEIILEFSFVPINEIMGIEFIKDEITKHVKNYVVISRKIYFMNDLESNENILNKINEHVKKMQIINQIPSLYFAEEYFAIQPRLTEITNMLFETKIMKDLKSN